MSHWTSYRDLDSTVFERQAASACRVSDWSAEIPVWPSGFLITCRKNHVSLAFEGKVRLAWKRPVRRCEFIVQMTRDPAATEGWQQVAISIRQSCELSGLESGAKHWLRVAANNSHGLGPWSSPVCVRPA